MKIDELDKNFAVKLNLTRTDVEIYDILKPPFALHGLLKPSGIDDRFRRMPEDVAAVVSEGVLGLHANTAGGRLRFRTDSDYIAIIAQMPADKIGRMSHFPLTGSSGFDLYTEIDGRHCYFGSFIPPYKMEAGYESERNISNPAMREYCINFPLYSDVSDLKLVLASDAKVLPPRDYTIKKPVVYYGSSITQGGCASRPGNSYQSLISRMLDCDYINLGFSGNAKGEDEMAHYIASLDMSAFVYDYDHNAPTEEHLGATHKRMFDIIRAAHPDMPIICVSGPVSTVYDIRDSRREIIKNTVNEAKSAGDENVYFVDGADFGKQAYVADSMSVDGCHPNDLGFICMAKCIGEALQKALLK